MNKTERKSQGGLAMWRRAILATAVAVVLALVLMELTAVLLLQGKLPEDFAPLYALGCAGAAAFLLGLLRPGGKGGLEAALPLVFLAILGLCSLLLATEPAPDPGVLARNLLITAVAYAAGSLIKLNKSRKSKGKRKNKKYK
jgi:hypothetical protein